MNQHFERLLQGKKKQKTDLEVLNGLGTGPSRVSGITNEFAVTPTGPSKVSGITDEFMPVPKPIQMGVPANLPAVTGTVDPRGGGWWLGPTPPPLPSPGMRDVFAGRSVTPTTPVAPTTPVTPTVQPTAVPPPAPTADVLYPQLYPTDDTSARAMRFAQGGYDPTGVARPTGSELAGTFKAPDTAGVLVRPDEVSTPNDYIGLPPDEVVLRTGVLTSDREATSRALALAALPDMNPADIDFFHSIQRYYNPATGSFEPLTDASEVQRLINEGTPSAASVVSGTSPAPGAVPPTPPPNIPGGPNDLADEEFSGAWYWLQTQGTLSPGSISTTHLDTGEVDAEGNPIFAEVLTPRSRALLDEHNRKRAEIETTRAFEEKQTRAGEQYGLQEEQLGLAGRAQTEVERAAEAREALERQQLGLAERVWNPVLDQWEMAPPPSTLAERQLGQRRTEATEAESFRRAQLAEQVAGREAQATQVQLAREQESELARLAMGVRGEPTYDDWGRAIPGAIPSTLGQRQLEEQVTARGQEQQLARLAMGLGPTGTMDPSQTLASRRFEEERQLERVRMGLDPTATMDPTQTLAARQFAAQMGIGEEGREAIPYQQLELQRALAGLAGEGGEIPQTLAERQFVEQQRLANIQAGITAGQPTTAGLPFRQFEEQERQALEEEAMRRIQLGIPLGDLAGGLPQDFQTRAELEAGLERTSREQQASMQRDLERTLAEGARGLTEREQNIQRRLAEISLGLDEEGRQALPSRQLAEDIRATQRGEALQQAALQGRIGGDETVAGRAQTEVKRSAEIREALERAQLLGTLDGTDTLQARLAEAGLTGLLGEDPTLERARLYGGTEDEPTLEAELARRQLTEAERIAPLMEGLEKARVFGVGTEGQETLEAELARAALEGRISGGELGETVAGRVQTEAERAAEVREALQRAQVFGAEDGEFTLEAQLARAGLTGMFDQQPTMERARLFGGTAERPTLEAELARAGLTGMLGEDPTLARRQLAQQGETASLNALVNVFQSAMQNPYAFSAMRTMAGGGAPFENLLAPLGFAMPGQVGQGAGQFFPGGTPTMGQFAEADPEGLNYLQALLGFSGVSPAQLAQQSAGITPGVRALLPPGMGTFRGRGLR